MTSVSPLLKSGIKDRVPVLCLLLACSLGWRHCSSHFIEFPSFACFPLLNLTVLVRVHYASVRVSYCLKTRRETGREYIYELIQKGLRSPVLYAWCNSQRNCTSTLTAQRVRRGVPGTESICPSEAGWHAYELRNVHVKSSSAIIVYLFQ